MTREWPELTLLERQVLALVVEGRTNSFIRRRLGIGGQVQWRTLTSLYTKTGIHPPGESYTPSEVRQRLAQWGRDYFARERGQ
jgi:hypothetical protein